MIMDNIQALSVLQVTAVARCRTFHSRVTLDNCGKFRALVVNFVRAMEYANPHDRLLRLAHIIKRNPLAIMMAAFRAPVVRGENPDALALRAKLRDETRQYRRDVCAAYRELLNTIESVYSHDIEMEQQAMAAKSADVRESTILDSIRGERAAVESAEIDAGLDDASMTIEVKQEPVHHMVT